MEALKILHIVPIFHGGVGIVAFNITKALVALGHEVILASPRRLSHDIEVHTFYRLKDVRASDPFYVMLFALYNRGLIESVARVEKPDVVLTHGPLIMALRGVLEKGVRVVSIVHGTYANEIKYMWHHPIFGLESIRYITSIYTTFKRDMMLYRYMTRRYKSLYLVAVSKRTREELVEQGVSSGKVFSILNGVDKDVFKPLNKDYARDLVEEWFNVRLRSKVLLHVNPGPIKGTHILLKAVAMLKKPYGEDFTLLIVGRLGPRTYREYIKNMVRGLKLEENVKLLGHVEYEKLPAIYSSADLTVVPSYSEGGPLITPESLACGTPVVATDVGGNPEYLEKAGIKHLLIKLEDYDFSTALAGKILYALNSLTNSVISDDVPSWYDAAIKYTEVLLNLNPSSQEVMKSHELQQ